jgi:hypothetical protein
MSEEDIRVTIEGEEAVTPRGSSTATTREETPKASPDAARAYARRNAAFNELRDAKIQENLSKQHLLLTKASAAKDAAKYAWEDGDIDQMHARQREIAAFDAERIQAEAEGRRLEAMPYLPENPVEAFISGRDPATQRWLRAHPDDALALATNSDPQRAAKINAADSDAVAEGYERGTKGYFEHVERYLGMRAGSKRNDEQPEEYLKAGERPKPGQKDITRLSAREREIAESILWETGPKRGQPIGAAEYIRRRRVMDNDPRWIRLPD